MSPKLYREVNPAKLSVKQMVLMETLIRRNKNEAGVDLERKNRKRFTSTIRLHKRVTITKNTQLSHVCNRKVYNAEQFQSIGSNQTLNIYNFNKQQTPHVCDSKSHYSYNYNLCKRRKLKCKECNYRRVDCNTNVNYSLLTRSVARKFKQSFFHPIQFFNSNSMKLIQIHLI